MENIGNTVVTEVVKTGMKGSTIAAILVATGFGAGILATKLLITPIARKLKKSENGSDEFTEAEVEETECEEAAE